ncbi:MAG: MFS transporter [Proteobacteria bacterium]|nr:MAG: MFS transporter [Pseudomonadota bacterium]
MAESSAVAGKKPSEMIIEYFRSFKVLKETPREFWGMQGINFLDMMAYFALLTVITLFLSQEVGLSDTNAGYIVTLFTSLITILLLFTGVMTDVMGIRKSLTFAMLSRAVTTAIVVTLAAFPNFPFRVPLISAAFVLMAPSAAMMQTVFQSTNKRYTNNRSRGAGFNLWYLFMNIGAAASGFFVDHVRLSMKLSNTWIVGFGIVSSLISLLLMVVFVKREEQFGDDNRFTLAVDKSTQGIPKKQTPLLILKSLVAETAFWRFVVLVALLLGVRAVFVYVYLLMPKYWIRILGEDAAIGTLNAINPILIVVGLILFIPIANKFNIFKMLIVGAVISSLSLFALALPWQAVGSGLGVLHGVLGFDWLANTFNNSYYAMSVISMVLLSIGEVMWSPKLQEYTAAIAPEGQEGTYLGLSMLPWFVTKTLVSMVSGHMLARWVPEGVGERARAGTLPFWESPEAMWMILGIVALAGPIIASFLKSWLTKGARWHEETPKVV